MDPTGWKGEKDSAGGNVWTQEGGSERRMVLRGIHGPKREEVRVEWCWGKYFEIRGRKGEEDGAEGNIWTQEGGSQRMILLGGMFGPKREEVRGGWC